MKIKTLLLALVIAFGSQLFAQDGTGENENVFKVPYVYYGQKISPDDALTAPQFLKAMEKKDSLNVKVEAKIEAVCKKKGCWMDLNLENGSTMKVRFKDYEFFVPKDSDGKMAVVEGKAKVEVTDVATLRHYAEDAGKSKEEIAAITQDEKAITFEAIGVIIR